MVEAGPLQAGQPVTHRVGFEEDGYPFTDMGWSYNWAPDSPNHIGVTEFVVQKDGPANIIRTETPEEFCNSFRRCRRDLRRQAVET
jgi:hypothetical protein